MTCKHCGEPIRPNQTGGYYHPETNEHRSDQRCFLYATPIEEPTPMQPAPCEHCPHGAHNGMCGKRVEVNTYCACFGKPRQPATR